MSSLVIVIDMWNTHDPAFSDPVAKNIVDFCQRDEVSAVCVASYSPNEQEIEILEPYYSNSQDFFSSETQCDSIRQHWNNYIQIGKRFTHNKIADMQLRSDQIGFVALHPLEVIYYCNLINPSIDKIYVTGLEFDICLKSRPLGYRELYALNQANMFANQVDILVRDDCTATETGTNMFDNTWVPVGDVTYRYNP